MIIGIDLGTSNSAAAVVRGGRCVMIPSAEGVSLGGKAFPSYVAVTADGRLLVGDPARRQAAANPDGTVSGFKRRLGRTETVVLRGGRFTPEELVGFLLGKVRRDSEAFVGGAVVQAAVAVPARFDAAQRAATGAACGLAGFHRTWFIDEPAAAALAYGLDRLGPGRRIAVVDLGGGTLDVSILETTSAGLETRATSGDADDGGMDIDRRVLDHLAGRFRTMTGVEIRTDATATARLAEAAEIAKIELSTRPTAHLSLPFAVTSRGEPCHLEMDLTRAELERLVRPVLERRRDAISRVLAEAGTSPRGIDGLILVGGTTRIPVVRAYFEEVFGRPAERGVDPMDCVAMGAAIHAARLEATAARPGGADDQPRPDIAGLIARHARSDAGAGDGH